jgi:hypothetical protein
MHLRNSLVATVLALTVGIACSGRDDPDSDPPDNGCTGVCNQGDGGTNNPDGGRVCPTADAQGRGPIGQLRATGTRGQAVKLEGLVVTAVDRTSRGSQGDYIAFFWVVDPCFPKEGIYVDKYFLDAVKNYLPQVGDVLTIEGLYRQYNPNASDTDEDTRIAYRPVLKSDFNLRVPGITGNLTLTKTGTTPPPADLTVPTPNSEYGGARVHIPGPLTISNPSPLALKQRPDSPADTTYLGFEVSGGVLVNNYKTFGETRDGGSPRCDWGALAQDGGVSFPNGIRGVWDTYSYVPCADGGSSNCGVAFRDAGYVPGTDTAYTHVLYPQNCDTDLPGVFDGGTP